MNGKYITHLRIVNNIVVMAKMFEIHGTTLRDLSSMLAEKSDSFAQRSGFQNALMYKD